MKGRRCKPLARLGSYKPTTFRWWVVDYHISSGNAEFVREQLDKGLIDFGIVFGNVDHSKYNSIELPFKDIWGVLMRQDSPLAAKEKIQPKDL